MNGKAIQIIEFLGGCTKAAEVISSEFGVEYNKAHVSMWRKNGIPHKFKNAILKALKEKNLENKNRFNRLSDIYK